MITGSVLRNDRFYKAVGVIVVNISYLKGGWYLIYYNTLEKGYVESIKKLGFSTLLKMIKKEIAAKSFLNPTAKKNLLKFADESLKLNKKRNSKIHASIFGSGNTFYIEETIDNKLHFDNLDESKIQEIENIGDALAKLGRTVHSIPYDKEVYK